MYRVIVKFKDLQDRNHVYNAGDIFPRNGLVVTEERLEELASTANRRGIQLIAKEETKRGRKKKAQ